MDLKVFFFKDTNEENILIPPHNLPTFHSLIHAAH